MRIRSGFVSNSSSSSFILVVKKEDWDREYNALHQFGKDHVDFLCEHGTMKTAKINGTEMVLFGYPSGDNSPYQYDRGPEYDEDTYGELPKDMSDDGHELVEEFERKLQKYENLSEYTDY